MLMPQWGPYLQLVEDVQGKLQLAALDAGVHQCRIRMHVAGHPPAPHLSHQLQRQPQRLPLPAQRDHCKNMTSPSVYGDKDTVSSEYRKQQRG